MSSVGQAIGGIVGAVVGFIWGGGPAGAIKGFSIGTSLGGMLDPPKGPNQTGPRLSDLSTQTSTYGTAIPRVYGTIATMGNVFWLQGDKLTEVATVSKQKSGKGGGGKSTVTTYSYNATFAVGLCQGEIAGVRRIWVGANLIYDAGSDDLESILASNSAASGFKIYAGSETQTADPYMQADKGVANVPAYRGLAYIVFYNFALKDYGNSLLGAQVKVEVVKHQTTEPFTLVKSISTAFSHTITNSSFAPKAYFISPEMVKIYSPNWDNNYPATSSFSVFQSHLGNFTPAAPIECSGQRVPLNGTTDNANSYFSGWDEIFPSLSGSYVNGHQGSITEANGLIAYVGTYGVFARRDFGVERTLMLPATNRYGCTDGTHIYVFEATAITKYDEYLSVVASLPHTNTYGGMPYRACADGGYIWYADPSSNGLPVRRVDTDLTTIEEIGTLPSINNSGTDNNVEFRVFGNVLIRAWGSFYTHLLNIEYISINKPSYSSANLDDIISAECLSTGLLDLSDVDVTAIEGDVRGYRVSETGAIRSALEPLQGAFPFDVIPKGYKIAFVPRGGASVKTIADGMLDARAAGAAPGVALTVSREMDSQLPRRVSIKYFDNTREYDISEQYAERLNTEAVNVLDMTLPIVLNATEAAGVAEKLLYLYLLERYNLNFTLPPEYLDLEPGDVITLTGDFGSYEIRLTEINYTSGGWLECKGRYNNSAVYTAAAIGEEGSSIARPIVFLSASFYTLLDIPCLQDVFNATGFPAAMCGFSSTWPGGTIFKSNDEGQTWTDVQGFTGSVPIGIAISVLSAGRTDIIDASNTLSVSLLAGELVSVTQAQLLNGANYFAIGAHGRWEIVAAQTCALQVDGSYILSDFLRGRFGTEWAMTTHAVGDVVVLLTDADMAWIGIDTASIGLERQYRGITNGALIDSDASLDFTYFAVNLECLSPVYLNGSRHPSTNDWTLTWIRRSRIDGALRNYVDVALGETTESYEVEIYADNTYAVVKRTLTTATTSVAYTSAQQTADFGGNQTTLYVKIYQLSATVGRGYPLTATITR